MSTCFGHPPTLYADLLGLAALGSFPVATSAGHASARSTIGR